MMFTLSMEMGPMRWIPDVLLAAGLHGMLVLVWISGLRFAGPFVEKFSPTGMLLGASFLTFIGLLMFSFVETGVVPLMIAEAFLWIAPITLMSGLVFVVWFIKDKRRGGYQVERLEKIESRKKLKFTLYLIIKSNLLTMYIYNMKLLCSVLPVLLIMLACTSSNETYDSNDEFFNGEDLSGWEGNLELWRVKDGIIVGKFDEIEQNEFLRSKTEVEDFRLILQVRILDGQGNSGIQFRSTALSGGHVRGPQADIGEGYWGKLYEELGRAWLSEKECDDYADLDGWNEYEVVAVDSKIRTAVNGNLCTDLDDPYIARKGIIALQLHQAFGPSEIQFKDLSLERNPEFELVTLD